MDKGPKGRKSRLALAFAAVIPLSVIAASFTAHAFNASSTSYFVRQDMLSIGATHYQFGTTTISGLAGYWAFDDGSGRTAVDGSGNNDSIFITQPTWVSGQYGTALQFNGTNSSGSTTSAVNLSADSVITVSFWALDTYSGNGTVDGPFLESSANSNSNNGAVFMNMNEQTDCGSSVTNVEIYIFSTGGYLDECAAHPVNTGIWHMWTIVFDNSTVLGNMVVYLDGQLQSPVIKVNGKSGSLGNLGNYVWYLAYRGDGSFATHATGSIDDLRIYGRQLSAAEVSQLYQQSYGDYPVATSTSYTLLGAGGEAAVTGSSTSASYGLLGGFMQNIYVSPAPIYEQIHYHWRNDDGSETSASSATGGVQDTTLSSIAIGTLKRLRIEVANHGGSILNFSQQRFGLQYGKLSSTCSAIAVWTNVGSSTVSSTDWSIGNSSNITDGANTTNIAVSTGGVYGTNHTFLASNGGIVNLNGTTTAPVSLASDSYIELEYALTPNAGATTGATYCFRVENASSTSNYLYTVYPEATVSAGGGTTLTFLTDAGSESFPSVTPGKVSATSSILTVTTNNADGFNITVKRGDTVGTMSSSGTYIPDKTDWIAPPATTTVGDSTASTTLPNTLQFRVRQAGTDSPDYASTWWGSNDTTVSALFGGISSTTQTIVNRSTIATATTTMYVLYNVNVPVTQKTGSYSGSITYTAVANP